MEQNEQIAYKLRQKYRAFIPTSRFEEFEKEVIDILNAQSLALKDQLDAGKKAAKNLLEIQMMFDDEADIDNNGGPNRAMQIDVLADEALEACRKAGISV